MNDEAALMAAIVANPDDDTPRLIYADWLDENEAPIQAEFIRVQCRLAAGSAADPDYPDLLERYAEVCSRFWLCAGAAAGPLPPGFRRRPVIDLHGDDFRRGFLHTVQGEWDWHSPAEEREEAVERLCANVPRLATTTPARRLDLRDVSPEYIERILAAPGAETLSGLNIEPTFLDQEDSEHILTAVAGSRVARNLEHLDLLFPVAEVGLRTLGNAKFDRLKTVRLPGLYASAAALAPLTGAQWFQNLREVHFPYYAQPCESALLAALAKLPRLEILEANLGLPGSPRALAARGFSALARLHLHAATFGVDGAAPLARAKFPRLAEFGANGLRPESLKILLKAKWFARLRVLSLANGGLTNAAVTELAKSAPAPRLRILRLSSNAIGAKGLASLLDGRRFPSLTTLEVQDQGGRAVLATTPERMAELLSSRQFPPLRHLNLSGWPLGDAGAKALAANPGAAGVTRLAVAGCGIGERGLTALARSPHLQGLVELDARDNRIPKAAALLDPAVLPRLSLILLGNNKLTPAAALALHRARGILAT